MHAKKEVWSDVTPAEPILEPDLPIIDAHHHLWVLPEAELVSMEAQDNIAARSLLPVFRRHSRYLLDEFLSDVRTGHNVRASVFIDAHTMYRAHGPEAMRSVGEVEFVNGIAAMSDSGVFGDIKVCAGIVGGVDLSVGAAIEDVLVAHLQAGGSRYRGVRGSRLVYDQDPQILGARGRPHLLTDPKFRAGFKLLQRFGLSFDVFLFEPQLPDLVDLARAFPETQIILNHVGTPVGVGQYAGHREERFALWLENVQALAACDNVAVKLGGLGIPFCGFRSYSAKPAATSAQLATEWRPYIETCIEQFGTHRCMFESNFPVDAATCNYPVLWNAFKRLAAGASGAEKSALFSGTAARVYRLCV